MRVYQEINLILTNLNLMGSSSENRNKEHGYPLHNVAAGGFLSFFVLFFYFVFSLSIKKGILIHKITVNIIILIINKCIIYFINMIYYYVIKLSL